MKKIVVIACAMAMVGCAATQPKAGAEKVRLTNSEPQGCQFLGDVTGSQVALFTSATNLETGARNDLKNKAAVMGGNVVQILSSNTSELQIKGNGGRTGVTFSANVYNCPQK